MTEKFLITIGALAVGAIVVVVFSALLALPVMWLWNGVMPNLFTANAVRSIDFWNAWGLSILCGLLLKASTSTKSSD